jgi:signal transduction histidine kinase
MLAKDVADRADSLQLVRKISGGVKRLEALVGQVLQFTREINVDVEPMDLAAAVEQAVEFASQALRDRGVTCEVQGPATCNVTADPLLIGQAILNLILNAVEAMEPGGRVVVRFDMPPSESQARQFFLSVRDTGPGIPPKVMDRIFNPFFTTKDTGTGLGLAIVYRVVEAHEGTITASNDDASEGGGARFEIRI